MPALYTDSRVIRELNICGLSADGTPEERRTRLAEHFRDEFNDPLAAWEVTQCRPWTTMTRHEASDLIAAFPRMLYNPAVLSRLEAEY